MPLNKKSKLIITALAAGAVILAVWWMGRHRAYPITNAVPRGSAIIAFGDSITAGYEMSDGASYPAQMARRIGQPVINAGVSGDTTGDGLRRLERDVLARDPRIVLLCLGGNDILRNEPTDTIIGNLEQIIRRIQQSGALVILITVEGSILRPGLPGEYRALARRTGCPHVPNALGGIYGNPDLMHDKIHPNREGYAKMCDKIEPVLTKYL